jgi:hypothetical protein
MVKHVALALVALTGIAQARPAPCEDCDEPPPPPPDIEESDDDDEPAFNMLGFRFSVGALPLADAPMTSLSLGIGIEHPVFMRTRVFAEYEWLWLARRDVGAMTTPGIPARPEEHATGHRALLGLRRELAAKRGGRSLRMFLDGELGGGLALVNDNVTGVQMLPTGFLGIHAGYDIYTRNEDSPSRTFEAELLLRAIAVRDGIGMLVGFGFAWGN